jgi:uncharacterized protein (TIGR02246 family)
MNSSIAPVIVAAALLADGGSPAMAQSAHNSESRQIQGTIDQMTSAFSTGNVDGVLATYEPGAVVVGEPGNPASGTPQLRALFERFVAINPKFEFVRHEIVQADDIALHLNTWKMTGTAPDGSPIQDGGLSVVVLRRQPDGKWLMVIDNPYGDYITRSP